jgi:hypothetical protein
MRGTLSANDQVVVGDSAGPSGSKRASAGNPLTGGNQSTPGGRRGPLGGG